MGDLNIVAVLSLSELGWIAGILDGEGSIGVYPYRAKSYSGYRMQVQVGATDPRMAARLRALVGGHCHTSRTVSARGRQHIHWWKVSGKKAADLLGVVGPYLVVKQEQASVALAFQATIRSPGGRARVPAETRTAQEAMACNLKDLKRCQPTT